MTEHAPLNTSPLPVKLRVEDYLLLDEAGAFADYAKTELIEGEILFMNAQHRPHARLKTELGFLLRDALTEAAPHLAVLIEPSVSMPPYSMPEPDIVVTSEPDGEGPIPCASVALIVEVADSTLDSDLGRKASLYARAGVPEYWIADVTSRTVHQMWRLDGDTYAERRKTPLGSVIKAATIPGLMVTPGR